MEFIVATVGIAILAYLSRWNAGLTKAFSVVGHKTTSIVGRLGDTGFQDAIIPTWWAPFSITVWLGIAAAFLGTYFYYGWQSAVALVAMFIIARIVSRFFVPKSESALYLRIIDRAVGKRAAELEREGDRALAAFAKGTSRQMHTLYSDRLPTEQQVS